MAALFQFLNNFTKISFLDFSFFDVFVDGLNFNSFDTPQLFWMHNIILFVFFPDLFPSLYIVLSRLFYSYIIKLFLNLFLQTLAFYKGFIIHRLIKAIKLLFFRLNLFRNFPILCFKFGNSIYLML